MKKPTEAHGSCDAHIEYVPTNPKGCQYPMRCKVHKKKGVGKWIKWAKKKEYETHMSLQSDNNSDAI